MRIRLAGATVALIVAASAALADEAIPRPDLSGAAAPVREGLTKEADRMAELLAIDEDDEVVAAGWIGLGDSYFAHDFYAEARDAYRAARALVGEKGAIEYRIGLAHMAEGRPDPGIEAYTVALDGGVGPLQLPARVRRGRAYLDRGDIEAALFDFRQAVRIAPDSPAALGGLGRAELAAGNAEAALQHLQRALELDPAATRLRQPLGMAHRALGDRAAARAALADVGEGEPVLDDPIVRQITQRSRSPQFFLQTGLLQADRGDYEAAAALIGRAAELAPDDLSIVSTHGRVLAEAGQYQLARIALERVTSAGAGTTEDWLYLGAIEQAAGRLQVAEAAFRRAAALEPGNATARESLGRVLLARADFEGARETFLQSLASVGGDTETRGRFNYYAGISALGAGECAAGLEHLETARAGGPPYDAALLQALARARATCPGMERAALEEALSWSEQIYGAAPGLETSATLAMSYAALGRFGDAIALQEQAMFEALKTTGLAARPGLQVDMARYREGQTAERAYRATDPLFRVN